MREINLRDELNALGIRFEMIGYVKAPNYPYGVYFDDEHVRQPDTDEGIRTVTHSIEIALYDLDLNSLAAASATVEAWINSLPLDYDKRTQYVTDEKHYCATYTLEYSAKRKD